MVSDLKKKYLLLAAVICLSMPVFTGCGNKTNDNGNQASASPSADDGLMNDVEDGVDDAVDGAQDAVDDVIDGTEDAVDDVTGDDVNDKDKDSNNNSVTSGKKNR